MQMTKREIEIIKNLEAATGCYILILETYEIARITLREVIKAEGLPRIDNPWHPSSLAEAVHVSVGKALEAASNTIYSCSELIEAKIRQSSSSADFKAFKEDYFSCMTCDDQLKLLHKTLENYNAND